jgi:hypothetical protein
MRASPPYDDAVDTAGYAADQRLLAVAAVVNARLVEVRDDVREKLIRTIPELRGDDMTLGEALRCRGRPLFVPCDESVAWSWLPLGGHGEVAHDLLPKTVEDQDPSARIAVGDPAPGVEGFRQTHRQALRAQDVANVARPEARATIFAQVGPVAAVA